MNAGQIALVSGSTGKYPSLVLEVIGRPPHEAATLLRGVSADVVADVLMQLNPAVVQDLLEELPQEQKTAVLAAAQPDFSRQWSRNATYPADSVAHLMDPPAAVFAPALTVGETIEHLRSLVKTRFITYCYVTDDSGHLLGVVTMRDLLLEDNSRRLDEVMLRDPFFLRPRTSRAEAMKQVLNRHYPVYPVCDEGRVLVGLVRGQAMFEEQAFELSAQPGSMVGVEKGERIATPLRRSFLFRHPWLQLNLLTAFAAGAVVAFFQDTVDRLVVLATFLPVLSGQAGNTGCQSLAVALRGLTLGELRTGQEKLLLAKEAALGILNGALTGVVAGLAMYILAASQGSHNAGRLGLVVFLAMIGSCAISGISGVLVPVTLRKVGADPATASSILLTTASDIASMGMFLGLATAIVR
jgi:magnesium transporter